MEMKFWPKGSPDFPGRCRKEVQWSLLMVLLPMLPMLLDLVGRASGLDAGNQPLSVALRPRELKRGAWSASCEDCQG